MEAESADNALNNTRDSGIGIKSESFLLKSNPELEKATPHFTAQRSMPLTSSTSRSTMVTERDDVSSIKCPPSHMLNGEVHPAYLRYGIPIYLVCTFALLLACDMGSGVSADLRRSLPDGEVLSTQTLLTVSVFSSVKELWKAESYPLAIIIVITSISWPYLKLIMSLYAWTAPFNRKSSDVNVTLAKREKMLFWLDVLGKWSFVDVFVLIIMMVIFRSTIDQGYLIIDIWILPKWGFFGFMLASVLSIFGTHVILHSHRSVQDRVKEDCDSLVCCVHQKDEEESFNENRLSSTAKGTTQLWEGKRTLANLTKTTPLKVLLPVVLTIALQMAGAFVKCFTFTYSGVSNFTTQHSLVSIGSLIPGSYTDPSNVLIRLVQAFYFILAIALPVYSCVLLLILFLWPFSTIREMHRLFILTEIAFAWSSLDVYALSAVSSASQVPKFSTGIVDTGCRTCYEVVPTIAPSVGWAFAGAAANLAVGLWLLNKAHRTLFARPINVVGCFCTGKAS